MKTYPSARAIIALAALVALIGSATVFTTEAAPVAHGVGIDNFSTGFGAEQPQDFQQEAVIEASNNARRLQKRQTHPAKPPIQEPTDKPSTTAVPPHNSPTAPTNNPPAPSTNNPPAQTNNPKPVPKPSTTTSESHRATTTGTASTNTGASGSGSLPTATSVLPITSGTPVPGSSDDGVPTKVSTKVFIGLGTVGGFIVFALGGLAFCRHRKKKNLASALLQQTAQFNNNNPYAKLPEPVASPKESLPMTPTKPLGTYNVVAIYQPALADEIEMGLGDSVTILQEYDDGWCMGVNNSRGGAKGVFPRHCVEMGPYEGSQHGAPGGPHYPPSPSFKATANKRISSIAPAPGWNDGPGYNGGGHGPQPSPQYLGPNQGPPHQAGGGGFYNGGGY
ncbi:hypothetical protein EDD11_003876 [Mortierella claussenii]|nr:hypothetical protein EDD11_003876 [Mortierella claussenii]